MTTSPPTAVFIGVGSWGRNVIRAFGRCGVQPAGFLVAGSGSTRSWLSQHFPGAPVASDLYDLLSLPASMAVVTSPRDTHATYAAAALTANMHVWVEKPPATTAFAAGALAGLAAERRRYLHTAFTYLFHPAFDQLITQLRQDDLAVVRFDWRRPNAPTPVAWELLPHELALAIRLTGWIPSDVVIEGDSTCLRCHWQVDGGPTVEVEIDGCTGPKEKRLQVQTRDGTTWSWTDNTLYRPHRNGPVRQDFSRTDPLWKEAQCFVTNGIEGRWSAHESRMAVAIVDLIERALAATKSRTGAPGVTPD
ncbi:Gfo/Idh/MocA family oxidoreductase [Antrihabitans spumae]|uniref:Gfo/Idh/MocA family oxidoreductase n=1 Tax=Antrihabitans spumae TaxID=3373370 RepID=A0ABW7KSR0_9NOCA